jgi:hypothetical protein
MTNKEREEFRAKLRKFSKLKFTNPSEIPTNKTPEKKTDPESRYQEQVELVRKIYEFWAVKDVTTLSLEEREQYRQYMDRTRFARVALESDRSVGQKLVDLNVQLARPCPSYDGFYQ